MADSMCQRVTVVMTLLCVCLQDWSSGLYLHGSLVFLYSDLVSLQMQVYNTGPSAAKVKLNLCGGDGKTMAGVAVTSAALPSKTWTPVTIKFSAFNDGSLASTQQINCLKLVVPPSPSPSPPSPPPPAPGDGCCSWDGKHCGNTTAYCKASQQNCEGDCKGKWIHPGTTLVASDLSPGTPPGTDAVLLTDVVVVGSLRSESSASASVSSGPQGRKVSPLLFGVNFAKNTSQGYSVNRWGGNAVTRYAWDLDVQNRAADYFFEEIDHHCTIASPSLYHHCTITAHFFEDIANPPRADNMSSSDAFIAATLAAGAMPVITIPTIGYTPFDRVKRCGFSIKK